MLFTLRVNRDDWNSADIVVQDLASGKQTTVVKGGTDGRVLPGGVLTYARDSALFAVSFDERSRTASGTTVALEQDVQPSVGGFTGASQWAVSASGSFAYAVDRTGGQSDLLWMTRRGDMTPTGLPPSRYFPAAQAIELSPDGNRVAARLTASSRSQTDVWIGELSRGTFTRLTTTGSGTDPVWTPDGRKVCYRVNPHDLHCQPFDGSAPSTRLFTLDQLSTISDISHDGQWLLLIVGGLRGFEVWSTPNHVPFEAKPLVASPEDAAGSKLSPDGRWLAYVSGERAGTQQVFVRPFPNVGDARWPISQNGGFAPRWSRDGRELYYLATDTGGTTLRASLTSVPVKTDPSFSVGAPTVLGQLFAGSRAYDVAPDGRFLITRPVGSLATNARIVVVQNWLASVQSKLAR